MIEMFFSGNIFAYNQDPRDLNDIIIVENDYTVILDDFTVLAKALNNTVTISLPSAPKHKQLVNIKCIDATFTCTVDRNGKLIDGAAANLNLALNVSRTLQYNSNYGWSILC